QRLVGVINDRLNAGSRSVDGGKCLHQRARAVMPRWRCDRTDHSRYAAELRRDLLCVTATLDEDVERLHHAAADVRVGEHLTARDRGAAPGEVLQLSLVRV